MYREDRFEIKTETNPAQTIVLVGWLGSEFSHRIGSVDLNTVQRGDVAPELIQKIELICEEGRINVMRGKYFCPFCFSSRPEARFPGLYRPWCNASIFIPGENCFYYAPTFLGHLIIEHHYQPPQDFLKAVEVLDWEGWKPKMEEAFEEVIQWVP